MESPPSSSSPDMQKLIKELPEEVFMEILPIYKWEGFWSRPSALEAAITFRSSFQARDDDVFLASPMKTGTTWLKALSLCVFHHAGLNDILTTENPHYGVPTVEGFHFQNRPPPFDPYDASAPRLLHTHLPYSVLPDSIKNSNCKIVYIARNPKDTVISMWHFYNSFRGPNKDSFTLEKMVDCFCSGIHVHGPFFEHVVGYWEESRKRPHKILFLGYEDIKREPRKHVERIAEFVGRPLADGAAADEVVQRCSLERLKRLEVNKNGALFQTVPNSSFFRKGEVGDWKNHLTPQMELRIDQTCRIELHPFGLFL